MQFVSITKIRDLFLEELAVEVLLPYRSMRAIACARFLARAGVSLGNAFLRAAVQVVFRAHSLRGSRRIEGTYL